MAYLRRADRAAQPVAFSERLFQDLSGRKRRDEKKSAIVFPRPGPVQGRERYPRPRRGRPPHVAVSERIRGAMRETDTLGPDFGGRVLHHPAGPAGRAPTIEAGAQCPPRASRNRSTSTGRSPMTASLGSACIRSTAAPGNPREAGRHRHASGEGAAGTPSPPFAGDGRRGPLRASGWRRDFAARAEKKEFALHYQPEIDLRTGRIVGAEAFVRWQTEDQGLVQPMQFIPSPRRPAPSSRSASGSIETA